MRARVDASRAIARRLHVVLVLSAVVGALTGLVVAGFEKLVRDEAFGRLAQQGAVLIALVPGLGLAAAALVIHRFGRAGLTTTDAYVIAYHQRGGQLRLRDLPAKLVACAATLGAGAALGYEGPAILIGGTIGSFGERRFTRRFNQDDAKVLMVAGAAAGVAAVFKAPLTGIIFALEVPYTQDLARRALLPALVAASASYLCFVALVGTEPVLAVGGVAPFDVRDLVGGLVVGVLCGALARVGAWGILRAKRVALPVWTKVLLGGAALAGFALLSRDLFDGPLTLGSGYAAIEWAREHPESLALLILLFVMRYAATWFSVAAGGVGGLFIPLVTQGAVLGSILQAIVHAKNPGLFPTVGIAAFLGAGYRTPLAGVAFVAEATGQPGFVVPALLAAAAAQLTIGRWSFSPYQRAQRRPALRPTTGLLLEEIMSPNPDAVDADCPLDRAVHTMMANNRRWAPVLRSGQYIGLLAVADIAHVPSSEWPARASADIARPVPAANHHESVADAAQRMRESGVDALAVTDGTDIVGVITGRDIRNFERLLDRLSPEDADHH